ncbi:hypothetical protein QWY20_03720 [Alkalimonas sp. MEB108]|uniref:Lipoprotein n=1 Tax=Alkalimonas cellulosilytica TaxID=3058395 RepID=A0ABU7J220_9GAMM|nr:hypothetical protein [Alkalimonas sp. MEB108]MEE2000549.1 hypothetical protein [Alkalimonas sp. MEB108]
MLLLLVVMALGCKPAQVADQSELLLYDSTAEQLSISPESIPVESLLTLKLQTVAAIAAITAEVTGESMYMGRVPIRFEPIEPSLWQAEFLLGACTDPNMLWRLTIRIQYEDGRVLLISEVFQSSWR